MAFHRGPGYPGYPGNCPPPMFPWGAHYPHGTRSCHRRPHYEQVMSNPLAYYEMFMPHMQVLLSDIQQRPSCHQRGEKAQSEEPRSGHGHGKEEGQKGGPKCEKSRREGEGCKKEGKEKTSGRPCEMVTLLEDFLGPFMDQQQQERAQRCPRGSACQEGASSAGASESGESDSSEDDLMDPCAFIEDLMMPFVQQLIHDQDGKKAGEKASPKEASSQQKGEQTEGKCPDKCPMKAGEPCGGSEGESQTCGGARPKASGRPRGQPPMPWDMPLGLLMRPRQRQHRMEKREKARRRQTGQEGKDEVKQRQENAEVKEEVKQRQENAEVKEEVRQKQDNAEVEEQVKIETKAPSNYNTTAEDLEVASINNQAAVTTPEFDAEVAKKDVKEKEPTKADETRSNSDQTEVEPTTEDTKATKQEDDLISLAENSSKAAENGVEDDVASNPDDITKYIVECVDSDEAAKLPLSAYYVYKDAKSTEEPRGDASEEKQINKPEETFSLADAIIDVDASQAEDTQNAALCPWKMTFNLEGFKPEDISVKTAGQRLVVEALKETQTDDGIVVDEFRKTVVLPADVDADSVTCALGEGGQLTATAPRCFRVEMVERRVPIMH